MLIGLAAVLWAIGAFLFALINEPTGEIGVEHTTLDEGAMEWRSSRMFRNSGHS